MNYDTPDADFRADTQGEDPPAAIPASEYRKCKACDWHTHDYALCEADVESVYCLDCHALHTPDCLACQAAGE